MADRYVWKSAAGANNGTSWADAWTELSSVTWAGLAAGDTLWIGAGTYTTTLTFTSASRVGTAQSPLNVKTVNPATDPTHGGRVIIDGGRKRGGVYEHLPYYGQDATTYTAPTLGTITSGMNFGSTPVGTNYAQYVTVDGGDWTYCFLIRGIGLSTDSRAGTSANATNTCGLDFNYNSANITIKYVLCIDIGNYIYNATDVYNSVTGVVEVNVGYGSMVCGEAITFDHVVVINPSQDHWKQRGSSSSIGGYCKNITWTRCWAGSTRQIPVGARAGHPFNDGDLTNASHADTLQVFSDKRSDDGKIPTTPNGILDGWTFTQCVFGPSVRSGGQLGEPNIVAMQNVAKTDCLIYGSTSWSIQSLPTGAPAGADLNWSFTRVTSDRPGVFNTGNGSMEFSPTTNVPGFSIVDSVLYGPSTNSVLTVPSTGSPSPVYSGNYRYNEGGGLSGALMPVTGDPGYRDKTVHGTSWIDADFALDGTGQATNKGSQVTSSYDISGRATVDFWVTVPLKTVGTLKMPDFKWLLRPTNYVVAVQSATEALILMRRPELHRIIIDPIYTPEVLTAMHGLNTSAIDAALNTEAQRIAGVNITRTAYLLPAT